MPKPYDDKRYQQWFREFRELISEFLNTDGNTEETLRQEFEEAISDTEEE